MHGEHHDLANEFPNHKNLIHKLKCDNSRFAKLCKEYEKADKELYRIEEQIETPSDEYTEKLKKRRLTLKDEIYAILKATE